jgi:hypothetical protein
MWDGFAFTERSADGVYDDVQLASMVQSGSSTGHLKKTYNEKLGVWETRN